MSLEHLEEAVLTKLLAGDHPVLVALRSQLPGVLVSERRFSGAGFFTDLLVAEGARRAPLRSGKAVFGDVEATIDGLSYGAGFLLWVKDGLMIMLEGYSYDEPWPDDVTGFALHYWEPERKKLFSELV